MGVCWEKNGNIHCKDEKKNKRPKGTSKLYQTNKA